jgi:hypothetical protein
MSRAPKVEGVHKKQCLKCRKRFPATKDYFHKHPGRKDGLSERCKKCRSRKQRNTQRADPEKYRDKTLSWRKRHPEQNFLILIRNRAKEQGTPFNLTLEDIVIPSHCPYLGIPLVRPEERGPGWWDNKANRDVAPSLDRIEPSKGYTKGNVEVISYRANRIKSDGTAEEHERIAARMRCLESRVKP